MTLASTTGIAFDGAVHGTGALTLAPTSGVGLLALRP